MPHMLGQTFGASRRLPSQWLGRLGSLLSDRWFALAAGAIVLLAAGLRLYRLDYQSLWTDEIFSLLTTEPTLTFREFWDRVLADTNPPLYYLVLRLCSTVFGQSEFAARMLSAFFGVLTLCSAAMLSGSSLARSSRLAFLLLLAISPGAVWYAREARSYAFLLLLSTVITLACVRFLRCNANEDREAHRAIVLLTAASALAACTHYFGFLLAASAFFTCFLLTNRRRRPIVVLVGSGITAWFVPWVLYHSQTLNPQGTTWIRYMSIAASLHWFEDLSFGGTASLVLFIGTAAALLATGGWRCFVAGNSTTTVSACGLLSLLTLAAASAISLHTPILTSRNMIVVLPALYLIVAEITSCLVKSWGKAAGATYLAVQVGLMGQPLAAYYTTQMKEQWRDSAALLLHTSGCQSVRIHVYGDAPLYRYFTKSLRRDLQLIEIPWRGRVDLSDEPLTTCPILIWAAGIEAWDLDDLLVRSGLSRSSVKVVEYYKAFVVLRKEP